MPRIRPGIARLFRLRPRSDEDLARELDEEIEAHVALRAAQLEERGLSTEEAHAEARRRFDSEGDAKRALLAAARARRETHPPRRLGYVMDDLRQDVRLWLRRIRRQPAFSATACLTLALGIGATTAIFSVIDSILLEPLPYHDPGRLVSVGHEVTGDDPQTVGLSTGAYFVYRESDAFEHLAVYATDGLNLSGAEGPVRVSATSVNHAFFPALGTVPLLGRGFTEADDEPGASPVVILGHGAWRRLFGGDLDIVGQTVLVNALEAEVVGVLPADFRFEARSPLRGVEAETELWLPFGLDPARARNINFSLQAFARLAPGVARERVETELDARFARPFELYPNEGVTAEDIRQMGVRVSVRPLQETVVGDIGGVLWVVMAAVGVILLIACANVANLFLVQAEGRDREVAVRSAIGASRRRVARTFLVESCGLGLVSGVAGLGLAALALRIVVQFGPSELPRLAEVGLDGSALAFTLVASLATGLAFGSFPVARLRSWRTVIALKEGGRGGSGGKKRNRARNGLVVAQLALALVLLAGSGLLLRTFWNLRSVDPGFRAENVLTFRVSLPFRAYPGDDPALDFHRALLERIEASPGVVSATAGPFGFPIQTTGNTNPVWIEDEPTPPGQMPTQRPIRIAMPGYFETLGIPLVSGRSIERRDIDLGTGAVVVSRSFVDLHWPDEDPLGKRIRAMPDAEWLTIVGVAGDVRQDALHQVPAPTVYLGARLTGGDTYAGVGAMTYGVRTEGDPTTAIPVVREALHEIDPNVPLADVSTLEVTVDRSMARTSFTMVLLGITSVVALMLGAVGIYGVMAYVVSQRTREVGVRMALGAAPPTVLRLVLGEAAIVVGVGLALGLVGATGLTHVLRSLLFGVDPLDPLTLGAVAVALAGAALVASLLPARRAARVDPMVALRHECG